jgi:hypothetical protein
MQYAQPTPPAVKPTAHPTAATAPPAKLDHHDTAKIRKACHHVTHLYPGAAGKILAAYLLDYAEWGYRITQSALPAQLVDDVLRQLPEQR